MNTITLKGFSMYPNCRCVRERERCYKINVTKILKASKSWKRSWGEGGLFV